jgi:phosphoribosyl 1,2-cyclic phosphate phosphodiesterase
VKITILGSGTSQGVPVIACDCEVCTSTNPKDKRLRTSVLIEYKDKVFVIDSGPDFRYQMLRANVQRLDALILTHEHKDHIAGLDDIRAFNYKMGRKIPVYATLNVQNALKREFEYIFSGIKYPGIPEVELHTIENNKPLIVEGLEFIPIEVLHYKLPVLGFRIKNFTYITDANYIADKEKDKIKGTKTLIINALRKEKHISHFTMDEAINLIHELKPETAYLTHISHQLGLHDAINKELPADIFCAFDGLELEFED